MPLIDPYFIPVITAGVVGGASTGLLGVYVVGMRIPLIGICMSHAAMAGSVFGYLLGWPQTVCGIAAAVGASSIVSLLTQERLRINTDVALGIILSLTMGLAFLGIGLVWGLFLALCGATLTVNLNSVGGLMIYSLMVNPAVAALQVCRTYTVALAAAAFFGSLSALGGFLFAHHLNLFAGACIVLFSSAVFAAAALYRFLVRKGE